MYWREFYFKERVEHTIQRADLDGSNVEAVVPKLASTSYGGDVALDELAGKLYWIYPGGKAIQRADLDGSNIEDIATIPQDTWNYYTAFALDLIGNKLYWSILYETNSRACATPMERRPGGCSISSSQPKASVDALNALLRGGIR